LKNNYEESELQVIAQSFVEEIIIGKKIGEVSKANKFRLCYAIPASRCKLQVLQRWVQVKA
jgi:hypothetical protein